MVVIGGGIIGCATAYYLAARGVATVLLEKGRIAGEQSSRNWGFVRQQGRDEAEMPMIMESLRLWRGLAGTLGEDVGYRQHGVLYLADREDTLAGYEAWLDVARRHQLDTRLLSGPEVAAALPGARGHWLGGLRTPSDGRAEPALVAPALARAATRLGATVLTGCAARTVETEGGRAAHVVTERGSVRAEAVVCAGGAWSSLFAGNLGIRLPQLKLRGSVLRTAPAPAITEGALWTSEFALRRRADGGYTVAHGGVAEFQLTPDTLRYWRAFLASYRAERRRIRIRARGRFLDELRAPRRWDARTVTPFERERVLDPPPNRALLEEALAGLRRRFPVLGEVQVVERWAGLIDVTPDAIPVISPVDALPGFYLATGFSGHGFGIGPGAGKAVADLVTGAPAAVDLAPFRLSRFD